MIRGYSSSECTKAERSWGGECARFSIVSLVQLFFQIIGDKSGGFLGMDCSHSDVLWVRVLVRKG